MKVSYFETGRYVLPPDLAREWPVPPASYDPEIGAAAFRDMVDRVRFVEHSASTGSACPSTTTRRAS